MNAEFFSTTSSWMPSAASDFTVGDDHNSIHLTPEEADTPLDSLTNGAGYNTTEGDGFGTDRMDTNGTDDVGEEETENDRLRFSRFRPRSSSVSFADHHSTLDSTTSKNTFSSKFANYVEIYVDSQILFL